MRENLFNPTCPTNFRLAIAQTEDTRQLTKQSEIRYFECGDRDTEIRAIAKEIKQLVLREGYRSRDIALVVRQRAAYADTIARVMREESLPCNLESRIDANDIPANRAALKLFAILEQMAARRSCRSRMSRPRRPDQVGILPLER